MSKCEEQRGRGEWEKENMGEIMKEKKKWRENSYSPLNLFFPRALALSLAISPYFLILALFLILSLPKLKFSPSSQTKFMQNIVFSAK
jgi:hypothetical protein